MSTNYNETRSWIAPRNYKHSPTEIAKHFCVKNGQVYWKNQNLCNTRVLYKPAGSLTKSGYISISFKGAIYRAHAIAWVLYYNTWPQKGLYIDHINGIKTDNSQENLREVNTSENAINRKSLSIHNKSGVPGVYFSPELNKWRVQLIHKGICISGGSHSTFEEAAFIRRQLEMEYHLIKFRA